MRCSYYCCGDVFDLPKIVTKLGHSVAVAKIHENEVLLVQLIDDANNIKELFIFSYGCVAFWDFALSQETEFLRSIDDFLINPLTEPIIDSCSYELNAGHITGIDEEADLITLESHDPYIKLSLSYGLSQSVKLTSFENSVDKTVAATKHIPQNIIKTGKVALSRRVLSIKIGELFAERNSINLHSTILDTPEFFWRRPRYQTYYDMSVKFMDIHTRLEILNKRLSVIQELYQMLSNELQYIHASRLELVIIFLIMIEVVLGIWREFY
ncbi:hypothetical protein EDM53_01230 [Rickettsiales endosymbiont of Peranema trichophorum]|uniref:RMD1 family protein n=1 Tax=Rickettsiales endosymbiont of Peranema trichophorum TaxID=2486577 RepID=UPI001023A888|nr:RMD1 family protein [Rickettsiales endosymbiont of Peranema trichophorum]RZI47552.1 hypothetical protein EDM53_01230 [Rickettsiales endosymbiont of Peranema trichophorum]